MCPKSTKKFFGEIRKFLDPPPFSAKGAAVGTNVWEKNFGIETCAIAHSFGLTEQINFKIDMMGLKLTVSIALTLLCLYLRTVWY